MPVFVMCTKPIKAEQQYVKYHFTQSERPDLDSGALIGGRNSLKTQQDTSEHEEQ